ncbi:MAG TPA: hypothetical protein VHT53_06620 [Candidatus Elarobacter sp.]|nr:hypothetical protein [Candidatus Elarobacter sp.]
MSTQAARGPRTLKGALVSMNLIDPVPTVILFQYNPHSLSRQLRPQIVGGAEGDRSQAVRYTSAPTQTISAEIEIDGTDGLAAGDPQTVQNGIAPQLAALEQLTYPTLAQVAIDTALFALGTIEVAPMTAPRILFVWGPNRVVPVQIESYSISEDEFDPRLNPLRATVQLQMRVLTYADVSITDLDYYQFLAYHANQSSLAGGATTSSQASLGDVSMLSL